MPRKARIDAAGALHHIIVRGIERRKIFGTVQLGFSPQRPQYHLPELRGRHGGRKLYGVKPTPMDIESCAIPNHPDEIGIEVFLFVVVSRQTKTYYPPCPPCLCGEMSSLESGIGDGHFANGLGFHNPRPANRQNGAKKS